MFEAAATKQEHNIFMCTAIVAMTVTEDGVVTLFLHTMNHIRGLVIGGGALYSQC